MANEPTVSDPLPAPSELIARRIHVIRGLKVMLDSDLAELYQVTTKRLNEAVKRNAGRFPADFMFRLTAEELANWRSQIATSNPAARMGLRRPPYAFTELGVAMLSSVLNSERAVQMNILIMRAFVKLRQVFAGHKALAERIEQIDRTQKQHGAILVNLVQDVQRLKNPPVTRAIGFRIPTTRKK